MAIEACRLALTHMCPVFILTDGYLANGAEPWKLPNPDDIPEIKVEFMTEGNGPDGVLNGYQHDPVTLARPWAIPGTPGLEHRIGGLEKWDVTGHISYDPENHHHMCELRAEKIQRMVVPDAELIGPDSGELLVVSWGGTYGAVLTAAEELKAQGKEVTICHLRYLNPFPKNFEAALKRFKKVIVPELNLGQLCMLIRAQFMVDAISYPKVHGRPFQVAELVSKFTEVLGE